MLCEIPTGKYSEKRRHKLIMLSRRVDPSITAADLLISASDCAQIRPLKDYPDLEEYAHGPLAAQTILLFHQGPESDQVTDSMQAR